MGSAATRKQREKEIREQLGRQLITMKYFAMSFFFTFFLSGCWHIAYSILIRDGLFTLLDTNVLYGVSVTLSVLCFGSLLVIFVLLFTLYYYGSIFKVHLAILIISICTVFCNLILHSINIYFTTPLWQEEYFGKLRNVFDAKSLNCSVVVFMEKHGCFDFDSCIDAVNRYIDLRCRGEFIACCCFLLITLLSIVGIVGSVLGMRYIKRSVSGDSNPPDNTLSQTVPNEGDNEKIDNTASAGTQL